MAQSTKMFFTRSRNCLPELSSSSTTGLFFSFLLPVGDLFRQSLTLTCWPTLPKPCQPVMATRPVSLEMETEMLRAVITAPPSSCQRSVLLVEVSSSHLRPSTSPLSGGVLGVLPSSLCCPLRKKRKKKHPKINLLESCPMGEVRLTESPKCISGIARCSLLQGDKKKEKEKGKRNKHQGLSLSFCALRLVGLKW